MRAITDLVGHLLAGAEPQPNGCWRWTRALTSDGYGNFAKKAKAQKLSGLAHRAAYELLVGPVPPSLTIDHTCHNRDLTCPGGPSCLHRRCINPEHLEAVTRRENTQRSPVHYGHRTHCKNGHAFDESNTTFHDTHRRCRACAVEATHRYLAKKKVC